MRLNEGCIQISSQTLAKSLEEVPILVLGLIFIEITGGPLESSSLGNIGIWKEIAEWSEW